MEDQNLGHLLTEGIRMVAIRQKKSIATIEAEIANLTGYTVHTVRYWRRGNIPKNVRHVELLTHFFVIRGKLDRIWCATFLAEAEYPKPEELLDKLFPVESFPKLQKPFSFERKPSLQGVDLLDSESGAQEARLPSPTLHLDVSQALRQMNSDNNSPSPLASLYLFRQIQQAGAKSPREVTNQLLLRAINTLSVTHYQDANLLQMRFFNMLPIHRIANQLNVAESTLYVLQRQAIERLVNTIRQMESEASTAHQALLYQRLGPKTYTRLIGVDAHINHLQRLLFVPEPPWLIAIEGIGGIGKTSLADALLRRLIQQNLFDEIGWVSARQMTLNLSGALSILAQPTLTTEMLIRQLVEQLLPSAFPSTAPMEKMLTVLQTRLKASSHVIVIDNLETVVDTESLLPTLQNLANPTKFVLTSRHRVAGETNIYHFHTTELNQAATLQLVRQEAELSNLPVLADSSDADLLPIVETVGGNPLAIRLVVGQTHIHSLNTILDALRATDGQPIENLYTYIYRTAWESLNPLSQRVLLIMPLVNPLGDTLEFLAQVGNLTVGELRLALDHLVHLNLVDAHGGLYDRRYSIHSLTRTFLQQQVAKWQ